MTVLSITVHGIPAPQGSKRIATAGGKKGGRAILVENSKAVGPWRDAVMDAALKAKPDDWETIIGPVLLEAQFYFPRPKGHYGTGRNAGKLKPSAPLRPMGPPDLFKLIRSTEDALTIARVWRDDALVVSGSAGKFYDEAFTGARITITEYRRDLR